MILGVLRMLVDSTYLVGWPIDRSISVILKNPKTCGTPCVYRPQLVGLKNVDEEHKFLISTIERFSSGSLYFAIYVTLQNDKNEWL
jgi:hypothetical protein